MRATGHVREKGSWVRERASQGPLCRGFAFDPETGEVEEGSSHHHNGAWEHLTTRVGKALRSLDAAEARVFNGRMATIDGFEHPVVQLFLKWPPESAEDMASLEAAERKLAERGYLSVTVANVRRNDREQAARPAWKRRKPRSSS